MIPRFEFVRPASLKDALTTLADREKVVVLAGGTDVVAGMQQNDERFTSAKTVLDIHHLPELKGIIATESGLQIGAAVTFSELIANPLVSAAFPLLAQSAASIGSVQTRNRATLAGNFVNNAACADSVPPLLVYEAVVHIQSARSERQVPLTEFLLQPNVTVLRRGELVTSVLLPKLSAGFQGSFLKLGRRRGIAISRITLAVLLKCTESHVAELRVASGAVTPIGLRFPALEAKAKGREANDRLWSELARDLGDAVLEKTGLRWSSAYKLPVVQQMFFGLLADLSPRRPA